MDKIYLRFIDLKEIIVNKQLNILMLMTRHLLLYRRLKTYNLIITFKY